MMLLQLSSAQGPDECCLAVGKALARLMEEAQAHNVALAVVEREAGRHDGAYRSVLVSLDGADEKALSARWCGTVQWICQSPYRPHHARKNWFIGVAAFTSESQALSREIRFESLRSSGPGGQHVNKTDSAVRATHIATGISVKVQSERSQHANKRLATLLIAHRLEQMQDDQRAALKSERRLFHHHIARGNPTRTFKGMAFNAE